VDGRAVRDPEVAITAERLDELAAFGYDDDAFSYSYRAGPR
jgi:hypothetical protein